MLINLKWIQGLNYLNLSRPAHKFGLKYYPQNNVSTEAYHDTKRGEDSQLPSVKHNTVEINK